MSGYGGYENTASSKRAKVEDGSGPGSVPPAAGDLPGQEDRAGKWVWIDLAEEMDHDSSVTVEGNASGMVSMYKNDQFYDMVEKRGYARAPLSWTSRRRPHQQD